MNISIDLGYGKKKINKEVETLETGLKFCNCVIITCSHGGNA